MVISDDESTPVVVPSVPEVGLSAFEDVTPSPVRDFVDHLFREGFGPIGDEAPLDVFPPSFRELPSPAPVISYAPMSIPAPIAALASVAFSAPQTSLPVAPTSLPASVPSVKEVGSSSREMRQVFIEVPVDGSLFKKSGQPDVWLKPLIGPTERAKLDSHSSLAWANEIVHTSLKINLIGTELMKRVSNSEQEVKEWHAEADNWKGKYESLRLDMESLEEEKCTLEQEVRVMTAELDVEKASSDQAGKDKNILESSFAE